MASLNLIGRFEIAVRWWPHYAAVLTLPLVLTFPLVLSLSKDGRGHDWMSFYVHILRCIDGSYYLGHTDALESRISSHEIGTFGGYTKSRRPIRLVYSEEFASRDDAFHSKRQIKGWSRAKKEALITGEWDTLISLSKSRMSGTRKDLTQDLPTSGALRPSTGSGRAAEVGPAGSPGERGSKLNSGGIATIHDRVDPPQ
jgi:predicted GIY-YIG superfamily endonuclease